MDSFQPNYIFFFFLPIIVYWITYRLSFFFFQRLTSRWFAFGVSSSFLIGNILFFSLTYFQFLNLSNEYFELLPNYLIITSLLSLIPLNFLVLPFIYWCDKSIAIKQNNQLLRVPENALHALTFCGGYLGAWIGQKLFNHKVSKTAFKHKYYLITFLSILIFSGLTYLYLK